MVVCGLGSAGMRVGGGVFLICSSGSVVGLISMCGSFAGTEVIFCVSHGRVGIVGTGIRCGDGFCGVPVWLYCGCGICASGGFWNEGAGAGSPENGFSF